MSFKGHNIRLSNGLTTRDDRILLRDTPLMVSIQKTIKYFIPEVESKAASINAVDLACMEGGYALELARMGIDTLGIEARKEHLINAAVVKLDYRLPNLNFVLDDVRNLPDYGPFDLTLCLGILYHLDEPAAFLKTLFEQTNRLLIIHTFYAPDADLKYDCATAFYKFKRMFKKMAPPEQKYKKMGMTTEDRQKITGYIQHVKNYRLGRLTENEGYKGRWYKEWNEDAGKEQVENKIVAAYNNPKSFWLCKKGIIKALYDAGFSTVYEQMDDIGDLASKYPAKFYSRGLLVALK